MAAHTHQHAVLVGVSLVLAGCLNGQVKSKVAHPKGFALRTAQAQRCLDKAMVPGDAWTPPTSTDTRPFATPVRSVQATVRIFRMGYVQTNIESMPEHKTDLVCQRDAVSIPVYDNRPADYWKFQQALVGFSCETIYHGHTINAVVNLGAKFEKQPNGDERRVFTAGLGFRSPVYNADDACLSDVDEHLQKFAHDSASIVQLDTPLDIDLSVTPSEYNISAACSTSDNKKRICQVAGREAAFQATVLFHDSGN